MCFFFFFFKDSILVGCRFSAEPKRTAFTLALTPCEIKGNYRMDATDSLNSTFCVLVFFHFQV